MDKIKKVIVVLDDGSKVEFEGQFALFVEDEMSKMEKMLKGNANGKIVGAVHCKPDFLASVGDSILEMLGKETPGLDLVVMMKHLDSKETKTPDIMSVLDAIFD